MRPGLQAVLFPDGLGEASAPALARERLINIQARRLVDQPRITAHIVVDRRELDNLAQKRDRADRTEILMPNHGLGDGFCLWRWCAVLLGEVQG